MKKQPSKRKKVKNLSYNLNKKVLPVLIRLFKTTKGKSKSVNQFWIKSHLAKKLQLEVPSRVTRKLIHHIRVNGLVKNLIAFTNGYYIATTPNESATYIKRVGSHIKELQDIKKALTKQHKDKYGIVKAGTMHRLHLKRHTTALSLKRSRAKRTFPRPTEAIDKW